MLTVAPEFILELLKPLKDTRSYIRVIKDPLPADVKLVDIGTVSNITESFELPNTVLLKIESEHFDKTNIGEKLLHVNLPTVESVLIQEPTQIIEKLLEGIESLDLELSMLDNIGGSIREAQAYLKVINETDDR
jgi:hypothetical protein